MTADQPLVTHADLGRVAIIEQIMRRNGGAGISPEAWAEATLFVSHLRKAAEKDAPELPEGWVLVDGLPRWHDGKGGISFRPESAAHLKVDDLDRDRLTPLATFSSVIPEGWHVDEDGEGRPTIWDADDRVILPRIQKSSTDPLFDVLAEAVRAAQAERGETA